MALTPTTWMWSVQVQSWGHTRHLLRLEERIVITRWILVWSLTWEEVHWQQKLSQPPSLNNLQVLQTVKSCSTLDNFQDWTRSCNIAFNLNDDSSITYAIFRLSNNVTVSQSSTVVYAGPVDILLDVPFYMGCYEVLSGPALPLPETFTARTTFTPASCVAQCMPQSKRFAGLPWSCWSYFYKDVLQLLCYNPLIAHREYIPHKSYISSASPESSPCILWFPKYLKQHSSYI